MNCVGPPPSARISAIVRPCCNPISVCRYCSIDRMPAAAIAGERKGAAEVLRRRLVISHLPHPSAEFERMSAMRDRCHVMQFPSILIGPVVPHLRAAAIERAQHTDRRLCTVTSRPLSRLMNCSRVSLIDFAFKNRGFRNLNVCSVESAVIPREGSVRSPIPEFKLDKRK